MANFSIQSVVDSKTIAMSGFNSSSKANMRLAMRSESGADGASFSADALNKLKDSAAKSTDGIVGTKVKGSVGDTSVEFNSSNGKLNVGGTDLKLGQGGFANALKDNLSVEKKSDGSFVVNNLTDNTYATFDSSGNITKTTTTKYFDKDGKELTSATGADPSKTKSESTLDIKSGSQVLDNALLINNSGGSARAAGTGNNMVINRAAGATISGTGGADKLFNLSTAAAGITGGGGNDAVYSVGLNAGANINMAGSGSEMSYVKLLGNMKGGSVTMTGDTALLDASGKTLNNVNVTGKAATSAVVANTLTGDGSKINMSGTTQAAVDLKKVNMGSVTMGTGSNSVFIDSVTGNASTKAKITTAGEDTLRIKSMNNANLTQSGNKSSWMKLVSGMSNGTLTLGEANNSIDASKANFNKASIVQAGGTGATAITAKSFNGTKDSKNAITLQGDGNSVSFSGTVQNASIQLGTGANTLAAGKIDNALIKAGTATETSKADQNITVKGGANKMEYQGSEGGDNLSFGGGITDSKFDLGAGTNSFTVVNDKGKAQSMTNVNITASAGETTLTAGNLKTKGAAGSNSISLGGSSTVSLGNVGASSTISLGTGANTMHLGGIAGGKDAKQVTISMGANGTNEQTLNLLRATKNADISFGSGNVTINSAGAMSNSKLTLGQGTNTVTLKNLKAKANAQDQALSNMVITAGSNSSTTITAKSLSGTGKTSSSVTLGNGTNNMSLSGSIGQNTTISLGTGSNTIDAASINGTKNAKVNITVRQGSAYGSNSLTTLNTNKGGANHLNFTGNSNADSLKFSGGVNNSTLDMGAGVNSLTAVKKNKKNQDVLQALNNVNVIGATAAAGEVSSMSMNVGALKGKSNLTLGGSNDVTLASVGAGAVIDLGLGSSSLNINKGITGGNSDAKKVTIRFGSGGATTTNSQSVTIRGNVKGLNYQGARGDDTLKIIGSLSNSNIDLGSGANSLTVENESSAGMTISNSTIKSTEAGSTNTIKAGNVTTTGKGNTVIDLSGGGGLVSLGNVSGNSQISTGTGSTTFTAGKFSGPKVSYTSKGYGSFIVGEISNKAKVDFGNSSSGAITIGTDGTGTGKKANGSISDATLKFGTNSVTLIVGGADAAGTGGGSKNMSNVNIEGSNATSFTLRATNVSGKSVLNLGGSASVSLGGSLGGNSSIKTGTGAATITVKDLLGSSKDSRVSIDTSSSSSSSFTVTGDATNFDFTGGTGNTTVSFGSVNQGKRTSFGANINLANATTGSTVDVTIAGKGKNFAYTGSDYATETVKLGGEIINGTINLGGGQNTVHGTDSSTAAGALKNTTISDAAGATTSMTLSSVENSGSGTGGVNLNGNLANVSFSGTVTSDVNMNAKTSNVTAAGTVGKAGSTKTTNFTFGTNAETGNLTFTGSSENLKVADGGKGTLSVSFSGTGKHNKANVTLTGTGANTLNLAAEMNGLVAELGRAGSGGAASNTVNLTSGFKFGEGKNAANITFKGASGAGHTLNGGTNAVSNMNLKSSGASMGLTAESLTNVTADFDVNHNTLLNIKSASNLNLTGSGTATGAGTLTIGNANSTVFTNLTLNSSGTGATTITGDMVDGASLNTSGNIDFAVGTFKDLNVLKAKDLVLNGTTAGSGAFTANVTGNLTGSTVTSLGNASLTVAGTTTLGVASTTTYESLSGSFTGKAVIQGKSLGGGNIRLGGDGSGVLMSGTMNGVNITNTGTGRVTVGTTTTEFTNGTLKNEKSGTVDILGKSASGTNLIGGAGTILGKFTNDFAGTYSEGSGSNMLDVGGSFTGGENTVLNKTNMTAGTTLSKITIGGGTLSATNLQADVDITLGSLLADNQKSGTITGRGSKTNTLIAVGTQDNGAVINATGTQTQVGTGNGSITMSGDSELIINSVGATGKVKLNDATSKVAVGTIASGGNVDLAASGSLVGFTGNPAGGDLLMDDSRLTIGGNVIGTTAAAPNGFKIDKGQSLTTLGKAASKVTIANGVIAAK